MRVRNWEKFQHYKHRDPPWIRLYRGLLNDPEWFELDPIAAKTLVNLWLIASETSADGTLPASKVLAFRLRIDSKTLAKIISQLDHWLEHDASTMLADCKQVATPETETETETETDKNSESKKIHLSSGDDVSDPKKLNGHESDEKKASDNWNTIAQELGLPIVRTLSPERRRRLKARLHEHGLKGWNEALRNLRELPFCLGANKSGWKADFDFMLQPTSFNKVLEMAYAQGDGK